MFLASISYRYNEVRVLLMCGICTIHRLRRGSLQRFSTCFRPDVFISVTWEVWQELFHSWRLPHSMRKVRPELSYHWTFLWCAPMWCWIGHFQQCGHQWQQIGDLGKRRLWSDFEQRWSCVVPEHLWFHWEGLGSSLWCVYPEEMGPCMAWQVHGVNYKTTALQLRYTFSSGNKLLTKVKVWQVPGAGHQAGQIDVMYWTGSEWEAVSGQSPSGFQSTGYGEELTISFNSVSTDQLRLDFYSHNSASNPICVGATEVQLIGCNAWPHKTASEDKRTRQGLLSARRAETFASDMRWHRPKEWFRTSRFHSFSEEVALLAYMQNPLTCL